MPRIDKPSFFLLTIASARLSDVKVKMANRYNQHYLIVSGYSSRLGHLEKKDLNGDFIDVE
jgi:hypothetical protein